MSPPFDETADRTGPDLLSALADAGPPLALVDADDRIVWCSQAFAGALTGGTAAELHGRAVSAVLSGAGAPPLAAGPAGRRRRALAVAARTG
jgi:hypothetical protein